MSLVGVRVSVQESLISSSSQDSPQGMDMEDWPLRRNKSWNPHEQLPWAQWTSLYLEKLNMLSTNIEVLSGKGMRSTVGHHRSQCAYFLVFWCYSRETCTGLGKAVSSAPPLVRVPPVIHFALLIVQLELSLVSFEVTFRYSYEHSSFQALLLGGTRMSDQVWLNPPALNQHSVRLEVWHYVCKACSAVAEKDCKEVIWHIHTLVSCWEHCFSWCCPEDQRRNLLLLEMAIVL